MDDRYDRTKVDPAFRPLCERLQAECDAGYQIGVRVADYQRWIAAGVLNMAKNVAGTIPLREALPYVRRSPRLILPPFVPV